MGWIFLGMAVSFGLIVAFSRHRHKWSKWEDYANGTAMIVQIKRCRECGLAVTRSS